MNCPSAGRRVPRSLLLLMLFAALRLCAAPAALQWNGNLSDTWDVNATPNWLLGTTAVVFTNGASAFFADSATGSGNVTLSTAVQPNSVTVSNQSRNFTFSGTLGTLSPTAGLSKLGSAIWTLRSGPRIAGTGTFSVGGGTVLLDSVSANVITGETWVGATTLSSASMVLSNSVLTNTSWLAVGRGNGTSGFASSLALYDSTYVCANLSLGYAAGVAGNLQSPSLTLNGSSRLINTGGTGCNIAESSGSGATVTLLQTSYLYSAARVLLGMQAGATGMVLVANSAALTNGGYAAVGAVGQGTATLKDNATWQSLTDFNVADTAGSQGTLNIQDNAKLVISTLYVGKSANSTGVVNQAGGSVLRNGGGDWRIGGNSSGAAGQFGVYNLSNGVFNAGGANLQVGAYGIGVFNQYGGTASVSGWPSIGRYSGGLGTLNIAGGVFSQTASGNALIIGEEGTGTLNVSGSGVVNVANDLRIGQGAGAVGTVNLDGGTLSAKRVYMANSGATSTFNFNSGKLQAAPGADSTLLAGLSAAFVKGGGALIDTGTNATTISQDLLNGGGNGGLTKLGAGTLSLAGANNYTGPTAVSNGTLVLSAPKSFASSACTVAPGACLGVRVTAQNAQLRVPSLSLAAAGSAVRFDFLGLGGQATPPLFVTNLAANGGVTVNIAGINFQTGRFPLLAYGTRSGPGAFVLGTLPSGMVASLATNLANKTIDLDIMVAPVGLPWQLKQAPLMTDWAQQVDPNNPWPEYPRPQMQRTNWMNLNGVWQWQPGAAGDPLPGAFLSGTILVPFCMESAISGVMEQHDRAWYQRTFTVPAGWSGQRVLLHFDAVDWECEPFLNGVSLGVHQGGYDPFTFDVTPFLTNSGPQTLTVRVYDPTDSGGPVVVPLGKQRLSPSGIWYTSCSGIWQTVWLEPVPATSIADVHLVPDIDAQRLKLNVSVAGPSAGVSVSAVAFDGTNQVSSATGLPGTDFNLLVPAPKLWSPTNPFLYNLRITLAGGSATPDSVASYFGMRKISLGTNNGFTKMFLNNQFAFEFGPLDQGYWPDGIYTPPTDLAMREDIEQSKALGFNLIRKHMKVEPLRWFYYADKLGLMVWQDMPAMTAGATVTDPSKTNFESELTRMVQTHWNSPAVIVWTPFNEGWGQYDTIRISSNLMVLDPSRLVNCASGWTYYDVGHMEDSHSYPNPSCPQNDTRAVVNGEFGGVGLGITNHTWASGWGYVGAVDGNDLTARFEDFCTQLTGFAQDQGLSAAVYTQITDVETELNGLYTYDRKVFKPDLRRMQRAIVSPMGIYAISNVVPTSQTVPQTWSYTFVTPAANWYATSFDVSSWSTGPGGFGTAGTPGAVIGTTWNTADIWLRRDFTLSGLSAQQLTNLVLKVHHDEGVEIYLNGVLAASATGYTTSYRSMTIAPAALAALRTDVPNFLAVHCHQTAGGQYIDVGLDLKTVLIPPPAPPAIPSWVENGTGLAGEYFADTNLSARAFMRNDPAINFAWNGAVPAPGLTGTQFAVRWSGQIQPRYSEVCTFYVTAADGCRLWVDGQLLIDKWLPAPGAAPVTYTGSILLSGGQHYSLKVEYYDGSSPAAVRLEWASASQARELVSQGVLFPNHAPVLHPVPDRAILAGQTLVITNSATDQDIPAQSLTYTLSTTSAGAGINPGTGVFTWRPSIAQAGANTFAVTVTDNGFLPLSATQTFHVNVARPASPVLSASLLSAGQFQMLVSGDAGPDYLVYACTNLSQPNWSLLLTTNPPALPFLFRDSLTPQTPQRFYRVLLGP